MIKSKTKVSPLIVKKSKKHKDCTGGGCYCKEIKTEIEKVDMCVKYLIIQLVDTNADIMTIKQLGFNFKGKVLGDFEVIVKKIKK